MKNINFNIENNFNRNFYYKLHDSTYYDMIASDIIRRKINEKLSVIIYFLFDQLIYSELKKINKHK